MNTTSTKTISQITRQAIFDKLTLSKFSWAGRMEEHEFIARLYDLQNTPSTDGRYRTASEDIWKHRVMNNDWSDDWIMTDSRFDLMHAPDNDFLRFLAESIHPAVRRDEKESQELAALYNEELRRDGWVLDPISEISGFSVFGPRQIVDGVIISAAAKEVAERVNASYMNKQITRMHTAVHDDPELAIGTAKEFIESIAKTILMASGDNIPDKFQDLVKHAIMKVNLYPGDLVKSDQAEEVTRVLLKSLNVVAIKVNELRGLYGTGHGKHIGTNTPFAHLARLAVHSAIAIGIFLFEASGDLGANSQE